MSKRDWKPGVYSWECGADVYPSSVFPGGIPQDCGETGTAEFDLEDGGDCPEAECTRCGSELSGTYDHFEWVGPLPGAECHRCNGLGFIGPAGSSLADGGLSKRCPCGAADEAIERANNPFGKLGAT